MTFFWREIGKECLDGSKLSEDDVLKRNGINGNNYHGWIKLYQGRRGTFFGATPIFVIIHYGYEEHTGNDGSGEFYLNERPSPLVITTIRKDEQEKFIKDKFQKMLRAAAATREQFLDSLEAIAAKENDKGKKILRTLANLL